MELHLFISVEPIINMTTITTLLVSLICNLSCLGKRNSWQISPEQHSHDTNSRSQYSRRLKFNFTEKLLWRSGTLTDCEGEIKISITGQTPNNQVAFTKINFSPAFDTRYEDIFRNIRRCSLAPLGDSYLIKQFELESKSGKRHFNHVIKIEPREKSTDDGDSILPQPPPNIADFLQVSIEQDQ